MEEGARGEGAGRDLGPWRALERGTEGLGDGHDLTNLDAGLCMMILMLAVCAHAQRCMMSGVRGGRRIKLTRLHRLKNRLPHTLLACGICPVRQSHLNSRCRGRMLVASLLSRSIRVWSPEEVARRSKMIQYLLNSSIIDNNPPFLSSFQTTNILLIVFVSCLLFGENNNVEEL